MTSAGAPVDALDRVLLRTCHLLIDFDGPVCSLFAGTPTAPIATRLRTILTRAGVALPPAIRDTGNWFEIFVFAAVTGPALARQVEHPVCTARDPMTGWVTTAEGTVWPVDHYTRETARTQQWLGTTVTKHHRRVATLVSGIITAGLILTGIDEPYPDEHTLARRPDLADHRRRPPLLILSAQKPR